jgi:2-polyprenyl-3-methyl-5-hydroxy-6-metoxy-1,4-benzoquinol methylase
MVGHEHSCNKRLGRFEKFYIKVFGYPALGLHIRTAAVLKYLKRISKPKKVLDAGCGNGIMVFEMAKLFTDATVIGIDNRQNVIEENNDIAAKCNLGNCCFKNLDLFDLSGKNEFDLILSTDNMEHMEDDDRLLELFYSILTPGGKLILHVPHMKRNVFGWKRTNFMGIEGHVRPGYYKDELERKLKNAGLTVIDSSYSYNSFETLFNDISYLITGGREKNRYFYAIVFPILLALTKLFKFWPVGIGSGIVVYAGKSYES